MSRPGFTTKPCEGCGETAQRKTGEVCRACRELMEEAKRRRVLLAEETERERIHVPQANYEWPGYYYTHQHPRVPDSLRAALVEVVRLAGEMAERKVSYHEKKNLPFQRGRRETYIVDEYLVRGGFGNAVVELDQTIEAGLQEAYALGVKYGSDLLLQLAAGTVTAPEFERRSIGV